MTWVGVRRMPQIVPAGCLRLSGVEVVWAEVAPFAKKYKMRVGMHNHSRIRENEFATPDDFDKARRGASEYIAVNLDISHFVAAGFDPVPFIEKITPTS